MTHPDKARSFAAIGGSVDMDTVPPGRSFLMDLYAAAALEYMARSGATAEDLARVVVKNQHNGALNPAAQYGAELTTAEVLAGRLVVHPFTLATCSPITDGVAAALIRSGPTDLGGRQPVNTSGGLLARGHPIGATGLAQIVVIVLQLWGAAGARQVPDARFGRTQNSGAWYGHDNLVSVVHVLAGR